MNHNLLGRTIRLVPTAVINEVFYGGLSQKVWQNPEI